MSVKPKIVCPPDYSILVLRFLECKKIGVAKGITTQLSVDLSNFAIPCTNFSERRFTVKAGKTQKLDISDIAVYWDLKEKYTFVYNDTSVGDGTSHTFTMYDEVGTVLASISFTVDINDPDYVDFETAFGTALSSNTTLTSLIDVTYGPIELSQVTVEAKKAGVKYNYLLQYDTTGWGGSSPFPYLHPGTLITKNTKYPEGRVRAIFLMADYARTDLKTCTCGCCCDASGDLYSNVKNFKWTYDSDYMRKQSASLPTGVLTNANSADSTQDNGNGSQTFQWLTTGNTAAYHLEVNNLVTLNASSPNNPYGYISNIDGYNITVNRVGFGDGTGNQLILAWSPPSIEWRVAGEMLFLSGGQDVYDTDRLYTETIWINNPQNYDIPFTAIIVS